jgi:DMSO reductase anchor subunit
MIPSLELPLVGFTILSQLAIGLTFVYALRTAGTSEQPEASAKMQWFVSAGILALGLLISLTHLGRPEMALRAVVHLSTSWLSREVLLFSLLVVLMAATAFLGASRKFVWLTTAVGFLSLLVQGMVYAPPSFPAIHNVLPFTFFLNSAVGLGAGAGVWFAPQGKQSFLRAILVGALCAGLLLFLITPCVWFSGDMVMRLTAAAYLTSPLYWISIVLGLAVPLAVILVLRRIPSWLPFLLLAGALCGRIVFFGDTVHSAVNIGGLY